MLSCPAIAQEQHTVTSFNSYESDSDDEYVTVQTKGLDTPRFCNGEHQDNPHESLKKKGIIDSGCSNQGTCQDNAYLADFKTYNNSGPVPFGVGVHGPDTSWRKGQQRLRNREQEKYTMPELHNKNRVAEGKNRTLIAPARTMLADSFLPNTFWAEAVSTASIQIIRRTSQERKQVILEDLARLKGKKEANKEAEALRKNLEQETENLVTQAGAAKSSSTNIFSIVLCAEIQKKEKIDFASVKTASTPIETQKPLVQDDKPVMLMTISIVKIGTLTPISVLGCFNWDDKSISNMNGSSVDERVSTDHAKLVPLGKVCTAKETLEKNTAKGTKCKLEPLKSLLTDISLFEATMAALESCPKHNMIAYLEKTEGNVEFHEVIDFLRRSYIYHALTVSPVVSTTFVEQFWTSAKSKTINNVRHITAKVAGKVVSISEASIRTDLTFDDADGIDTLPNQAIFNAIQLMGYEGDLSFRSSQEIKLLKTKNQQSSRSKLNLYIKHQKENLKIISFTMIPHTQEKLLQETKGGTSEMVEEEKEFDEDRLSLREVKLVLLRKETNESTEEIFESTEEPREEALKKQTLQPNNQLRKSDDDLLKACGELSKHSSLKSKKFEDLSAMFSTALASCEELASPRSNSSCPLSEFIDTRDIYDARLNNNCTVREIIHEGRWIWPEEWNNEFEELRKIQVPILSNENEDTVLWVSRSGQEQQFKLSNVWKDMNCNDTKVDWFSMVWFVQMLNVRLSGCWDHIINEIKALPSNNNIWSIVRRIVCGVVVYYIWQEKNNRLFKNEKMDRNTIFNIVKETVGMKLIGIKVKDSRTIKEVEKRWNVKMQRG
ncbi:hypothetical protein Tco_0397757 [Tanacetum coccineum]